MAAWGHDPKHRWQAHDWVDPALGQDAAAGEAGTDAAAAFLAYKSVLHCKGANQFCLVALTPSFHPAISHAATKLLQPTPQVCRPYLAAPHF